ncbi:transposase [Candidatus Enterovibrio escicola]|uniref:transposase n=1 Tax=Candidatus Enterovibrio escicola TaxID=1927127 RepID=UPI000BE44F08
MTFYYLNYYTEQMKTMTVPPAELIESQVIHISDKHFTMLCYYSFLSTPDYVDLLPRLY